MTAKNLRLIAGTLRAARPDTDQLDELHQWRFTVDCFAKTCAAANPKFKPGMFYAACGLED